VRLLVRDEDTRPPRPSKPKPQQLQARGYAAPKQLMENLQDSLQLTQTPQDSSQPGPRVTRQKGIRAAVPLPEDHVEHRKQTKLVETIAGRPPELTNELSKYVFDNADFYCAHGWEALMKYRWGCSNLNPDIHQLPHKAACYLDNI